MKRPLPPITETAAVLHEQLQREKQPTKRQRLHMLYLLASGQARSRQEVARLLGVNRNTVGRWLARYEQGGLPTLLVVQTPPGKAPTLTPTQQEQLRQALSDPQGFASYGAVQQWIAAQFGVRMRYSTVHHLVHVKLGAGLKGPRRSHRKKTHRL